MKETTLCKLAFKYGTDKCPKISHHYTPVYYKMLRNKRNKVKKVLEIGVGSRETMQWVPKHYQKGASLRMWRDFFPNAQIYGIDRDPRAIFQSKRIKTFLFSTALAVNLQNLIKEIGSDLDFVVDDGPHNERFQLATARTLLPLLKKNCLYVIEDAKRPESIKEQLSEYNCQIFQFPSRRGDDALVIVSKHQ